MLEVFLDSLKDSAIVLGIVFAMYVLLAWLEPKFSHKMEHAGKLAPLIGGAIGLIPQCGFSVVSADLYKKRHITLGTLIAVLVATSDEALPVFFHSKESALMALPLLGIKLVVGVACGYLIDLVYRHSEAEVQHHEEHCECEEEEHVGCCHHHVEGEHGKDAKVKQYLVHPLLHSLKIFAYVLVINFAFSTLMHFFGEDIMAFLVASRFASPAIAVLVGLIPNCASSVMLAELYVSGALGFGACVGGLCVNAGLGLMMLYKNVKNVKENAIITAIMVGIGLAVGYITSAIAGFGPAM